MVQRLIIFTAVVIVGAVLWFLLLFNPQSTKIDETRAQVQDANTRITSLEAELGRRQGLAAKRAQLVGELSGLDQAVPGVDPQLAAFILQVEESANRSGIEWLSVSPSLPAASEVPLISDITISMQVEGGYFQVLDFIVRIEELQRAIKIGSVSLSPKAYPVLSASFSMKMFVTSTPSESIVGVPPADSPGDSNVLDV